MASIRMLCAIVTLGIGAMSVAPGWSQDAPVMSGEIVKVDELAGKITVRIGTETTGSATGQAGGGTEEFGVQDGLLFNAVKPGQKIKFTTDTLNGQKRIVKIEMQ